MPLYLKIRKIATSRGRRRAAHGSLARGAFRGLAAVERLCSDLSLARGCGWKTHQKPDERVHVRPPSVVLNTRPSAVVTVAFFSSVAWICDKPVASGNVMRCHERPSVDSRTMPPGPTSQQIVGAGAADR